MTVPEQDTPKEDPMAEPPAVPAPLPCPFCGSQPIVEDNRASCQNFDCGICGEHILLEYWNVRSRGAVTGEGTWRDAWMMDDNIISLNAEAPQPLYAVDGVPTVRPIKVMIAARGLSGEPPKVVVGQVHRMEMVTKEGDVQTFLDGHAFVSDTAPSNAQLCPKCHGQKIVGIPPNVPGDSTSYVTAGVQSYPCGLCGGLGYIVPRRTSESLSGGTGEVVPSALDDLRERAAQICEQTTFVTDEMVTMDAQIAAGWHKSPHDYLVEAARRIRGMTLVTGSQMKRIDAMKIDLNDSDAMNRFHPIEDPREACEVVLGLIHGKRWPDVTLWRLHSFCEMAMWAGKRIGEGKMQDPNNYCKLP